jgi:serine/threonine protein kinase
MLLFDFVYVTEITTSEEILQTRSEIRILAMLKHPNVIRYFDCDSFVHTEDSQGRPTNTHCLVFVMEYANGSFFIILIFTPARGLVLKLID